MFLNTMKNPLKISYFCSKNTTILNNFRAKFVFLQTVVGVEGEDQVLQCYQHLSFWKIVLAL